METINGLSGRGGSRGGHAPRGNTNAVTHGRYSFLANGRLPRGCSYLHGLLANLRRELEAAVFQKFGEVSFFHGCVVQEAIRHEGRAQLCQRYLRLDAKDMGHGDRLVYLREIGAATKERNRCLRLLRLDEVTRLSVWDEVLERDAHRGAEGVGGDPERSSPS